MILCGKIDTDGQGNPLQANRKLEFICKIKVSIIFGY